MAGVYGSTPLFDLSYTYNKTDLRATANPKDLLAYPNTIYGTLQRKNRYELFSFLMRNSGLDKQLSACPAHFTIFAVDDEGIKDSIGEDLVLNIDHFDALKIIRNYTINNVITLEDIKTDGGSDVKNLNHSYVYIYYDEVNDTTYVNGAKVIDELGCVNGNIIFIDRMSLSFNAY